MNRLAPLILGLCWAAGLAAQDRPEATGVEAPPRYAVEVLVFEHLDQSRATTETPPPYNPAAIEAPAEPPLDFFLMDPLAERLVFGTLASEEQSLTGAWQRLNRVDAYRPLAYLAWSQTAPSRAGAQGLWLEDVGAPPGGLTGQVKLYKERFLHLALDLAWQGAPVIDSEVEPPPARITESRRLRGDTVQYFDNPRFGAITYVRELVVEPPPEDELEPAS